MSFDFVPFDLMRMFIGDASLWYLLEIIVRVIIIFTFAVIMLRIILGKGLKDMSFFDYFLVVAMGTAAGDPMLFPTIPLIYGLVALGAVMILKHWLTILTMKNEYLLKIAVPDPILIIEDGILKEEILKKKHIPKKSLYSKLRINGIKNLGEIENCYIEPSGELSIFRFEKERIVLGKDIVPPKEMDDEIEDLPGQLSGIN